MSNRSLGKLDAYEKTYVFWLAGGFVLFPILGLIGYHIPLSWVGIWMFIEFGLIGESEHKKIMSLRSQVQKLEERIDRLEKAW